LIYIAIYTLYFAHHLPFLSYTPSITPHISQRSCPFFISSLILVVVDFAGLRCLVHLRRARRWAKVSTVSSFLPISSSTCPSLFFFPSYTYLLFFLNHPTLLFSSLCRRPYPLAPSCHFLIAMSLTTVFTASNTSSAIPPIPPSYHNPPASSSKHPFPVTILSSLTTPRHHPPSSIHQSSSPSLPIPPSHHLIISILSLAPPHPHIIVPTSSLAPPYYYFTTPPPHPHLPVLVSSSAL